MKKGDKKRAYKLFGFSSLGFGIGVNRFSIKFCINNKKRQNGTKWDHVSLFLESKKLFLIRLHLPTLVQWLVYTRLVTRLHSPSDSSTLVYICLESSVTCLHLSRLVYTQLVTRLYFRVDQRKERFHKVLFGMISGKNDEKLLSFSHRTKDGVWKV